MTEPYVIKTRTDQSSHVNCTCALRETDQSSREYKIHMWIDLWELIYCLSNQCT